MKHTSDINEIRQAISEALREYVKEHNSTIQKFCKKNAFNSSNMYSFLGGKRKGFKPSEMQRLGNIIGVEFYYGLRTKDPTEPTQKREIEEINNRRLILETLGNEYNKRSDKEQLELLRAIISKIQQSHQQHDIKTALNQLSLSILNELK